MYESLTKVPIRSGPTPPSENLVELLDRPGGDAGSLVGHDDRPLDEDGGVFDHRVEDLIIGGRREVELFVESLAFAYGLRGGVTPASANSATSCSRV